MKENQKRLLYFFLVVAAIGAFAYIAFIGIGNKHRGTAENIRLGLDLVGGVSITYEADETPTSTQMDDTVNKMQKRAENFSTESDVYKEGDNRVTIDMPGVTNANEALEAMGKAGKLEFRDEEGNVLLDGSDIAGATATTQADQTTGLNQHIVKLEFNEEGTQKFAEATQKNLNKIIYIVYDEEVVSAPTVQAAITDGNAIIEGMENSEKASELASTIRIGALPVSLHEITSQVKGAKLGLEALNTSLYAGLIGFVLIILFMLIVYRVPGFAASIALVFYIAAEVVILNFLDVTLTLPGIAGIILSIGMAVDANVIIFTRIKEELATGKTVESAIKIGFDKAVSAIVDGNVTTLIAAVVLYVKGSGTVKGFATTLAIGIILSMFTAFVVTKVVLNALYMFGFKDVKFYGIKREKKTFDYIGKTKITYAVSILVIGLGIAMLFVNKSQIGNVLNYGLDFKGGTTTQVTFDNKIKASDKKAEIEKLFADISGDTVELSEIQDANALSVKTVELDLTKREKVAKELEDKFGVKEDSIETGSVSGTVSAEMRQDAIVSVIIAVICMLIYIWFRFKDILFGAGAVFALIHDVLVVLTVYAVTRISVGNTFIACMLTIVGYSINATIVIYDRIRENKREMKRDETLKDVVNKSITQTFTRSINSSLTTFITIFILAIFGVDAIRQFAIPLIAGIIAGCWSSVCIAGTLWYWMKTKFGKNPNVR
ncbi:MAG: protein translocase subunit SecD [Lachnospiraceae bacterium]|nr:protein translocase subunit SecD [Lachnospiraceae bacterium]